jgi:hypothetical protein
MIELAGEQIQHEYRKKNFKTQQFIQLKHAECSICTFLFLNPFPEQKKATVENSHVNYVLQRGGKEGVKNEEGKRRCLFQNDDTIKHVSVLPPPLN